MAYSYTEYTGDGTTQTFTIPFAYEAESEVAVFVAGTQLASSDFSFLSTSTISINTAPANNANVRVERNTDLTNRAVDFVDGAVLSEADLDTAMIQVFHGAQEAIDTANDAVSLDADGVFDAQNRRIKNVADPSAAQDAATKNYIENVWLTPSDKTQLNNLNLTNLNTVANDVANVNTTATNITDVNTVATDIANVNTVAGDSADIQTLAAISTDITTAAGISSDITTVAAKAAAVQKVADDLNEQISEVETVANDLNEITSEIETVANSITNVDTVGTNIGNVNTVAGINANVTSVAGNASNINAAVSNAANINAAVSNENNITAVANNTTNINAVNANSTNINTVAGNNANVTTVATNNANVTTVASNIADVQTAATNVADIQTIAAEVQKVITVANDLNEATSEIDTVAASITNVDAVGADIANVNAVAGNATNINAVNANSTNINAVNANATNINTVAGAETNINTVASNIADVNSFADTYSIGSTAPASPTAGDLWFDTSTGVNTMKVYNGSSWQNAGSSVNGTSARFKYTATAGQTTFSGSDANGDTLAYDSGYIDVFLNGIHLDPTDYTATNGTSIVLNAGATVNDELYVVAFGTFTLADHYNKTQSDARYATAAQGALADSALQPTGDGSQLTGINTDLVSDTTPQLGGNLDTNGFTVAGRDVAADGTKLDGIESGATADQIIKSTAAPSSPSNGDFWYDTDDYAFYFNDGTNWQLIKNAFAASGGTATDSGGYRYHTFTSSGTFQVTKGSADVEYLIIAGGGGGATSYGGGGGAGGYISGTTTVSSNNYSIVVGGGGANATRSSGSQYNGGNSSAFSLTAIGGGAGAGDDYHGIAGGSGGGASDNNRSGGAGTTGQGYRGGNTQDDNSGGAGGGGAGGQGADVTSGNYSSASSHYGGAGKTWEDGTTRASGGCGSFKQNSNTIGPITGGGGRGGGSPTSGTANTGGGGGGASGSNTGGNGGSGVVIIRYPI